MVKQTKAAKKAPAKAAKKAPATKSSAVEQITALLHQEFTFCSRDTDANNKARLNALTSIVEQATELRDFCIHPPGEDRLALNHEIVAQFADRESVETVIGSIRTKAITQERKLFECSRDEGTVTTLLTQIVDAEQAFREVISFNYVATDYPETDQIVEFYWFDAKDNPQDFNSDRTSFTALKTLLLQRTISADGKSTKLHQALSQLPANILLLIIALTCAVSSPFESGKYDDFVLKCNGDRIVYCADEPQ